MKEFFSKYVTLRKHNAQVAWKKPKRVKCVMRFGTLRHSVYFVLCGAGCNFYFFFTALRITIFWKRQGLSDWQIISA